MTDRVDQEGIKGNAFFAAGFRNLPPLERAVEHALALNELLAVVPGDAGHVSKLLAKQLLIILGREVADMLEASGRRGKLTRPPRLN